MKITDFIESDLKSRIDAGKRLPESLTLNSLSEFYDVSLTPVRVAIKQLTEQAYIVKLPNGRLIVNEQKFGQVTLKAKPKRITPDIDRQLLNEILIQSLKGKVVSLREEACAERFKVGRTVIRGIFNRFAGRGVIHHVPRCGWEIHPYSVDDMNAYLEVRETLELKALNLSRGKMDVKKINTYIHNNELGLDGLQKIDDGLHDYFIKCSGNPYIKTFFEKQGLYWTALFNYAAPETKKVSEMAAEHRELLQAILRDNWTLAQKILTHHTRAQVPIIAELVDIIRTDANKHSK